MVTAIQQKDQRKMMKGSKNLVPNASHQAVWKTSIRPRKPHNTPIFIQIFHTFRNRIVNDCHFSARLSALDRSSVRPSVRLSYESFVLVSIERFVFVSERTLFSFFYRCFFKTIDPITILLLRYLHFISRRDLMAVAIVAWFHFSIDQKPSNIQQTVVILLTIET